MIAKLTPACKDYLWGGTRLKTEYNKHYDGTKLAETWELSCHPDGPSLLPNGQPLSEYLQKNPEAAGTNCAQFDRFPLLIKLIDASSALSVQVHPDDAYGLAHEGELGKTEMWYVMDCEADAFLYYGFQKEITKEAFRDAIENNSLCDLLCKVEVKRGDAFFIEAGTIHAIGAGILIAEVQQSSNTTYRVYDYGRVGADGNRRELHIEKACAVTALRPAKKDYDFGSHLAACDYFTVDLLSVCGKESLEATKESFRSVLVLSGTLTVCGGGERVCATKGEIVFIAAGTGLCEITGTGEALVSYV